MAGGAAEEYRERELKFDVAPDWTLPDPSRLTPRGTVERRVVHLESVYYDTVDLDLVRQRVTLRRRAGDTDNGWQLKVPAGDARTEIRLPANGRSSVPAELREATLGVRRGLTLRPVARLLTERQIAELRDAGGTPLAEIVLDTVTATRLGDVARISTWCEVEVELAKGDERLLRSVTRWLRKRGAVPSASGSKVARALEVEFCSSTRKDGTVARLAGAYLDEQVDVLVRTDIALRRGRDAIHEARVATRRYRSVLRQLDGVFDPERAAALDAELKWYADALGEVRDRQVLRSHLDEALAEVPPELVLGPVAARMHTMLAAEEADAAERLAKQLRTKRHYALLAELRSWRESPPVKRDRPASKLDGMLAKAERKVTKRIARAPDGAGRDAALHRARKAAKRGRYLAELARPELGAAAQRARKRMKKRTQQLGLRQDSVVATAFLRRAGAAASAAGENGFTFGLLYERERTKADRLGTA